MTVTRQAWLLCSVLTLGSGGGCSAEGTHPPAKPIDDPTLDASLIGSEADSATPRDAGALTTSPSDAGVHSLSVAVSSASVAYASSGSDTNGVEETTSTPTTSTSDASPILEPDVQELTVAELCEQIIYLEGDSVDVDLSGALSLGDWFSIPGAEPVQDAGLDAMACAERFAAYVLPCGRSVLVLSAPSFAFGEGAMVGGERVGFGCWEATCEEGCLPEYTQDVARVRIRVTAPLNQRYDEELASTVGDIRLNGADVVGLAQLEILAQR